MIWSCNDYSILIATELLCTVNDIQWDPNTAYELTTVGIESVQFWILDEDTGELQLHEPDVPTNIEV